MILKFQVYARQKGFTFWPAKVIRITNPELNGGSYDVRFFGGYHQRAVVDKASIRPISTSLNSLGIKRSSLLNKACDELKKHQEFVNKVQASIPDFLNDHYGDPYTADHIKDYIQNLEQTANDNDDDENEAAKEELEQIKSALEEEDGSSQIYSQAIQSPTHQTAVLESLGSGAGNPPEMDILSPPKKKKLGRPPKNKHRKDMPNLVNDTNAVGSGPEENMVSSSSQEPRVASVAIQTPSKLLKDLIAGSAKISKDELRKLKEKVRKCFLKLKFFIRFARVLVTLFRILNIFFYK